MGMALEKLPNWPAAMNHDLALAYTSALAAFSRRSTSRSTASRIKSDCFSPGSSTTLMRASVPSRNRAIVCSPLIRGLPTGAGVGDTINSVEPIILLIPSIDRVGDTTYVDDITYRGKSFNV